MSRIKIHDKYFEKTIPYEEISASIKRVADEINKDYAGKRPLLLAVLNGSFMFAAELMKNLNIECEISFVKLSSYQGTTSTGVIREVLGITESLVGRDVIIVEDIVDTGFTADFLIKSILLKNKNVKSLKLISFLNKSIARKIDVKVDYFGFEVDDKFVVGYGLDDNGYYRNLPYIGYFE